MADFFAQVIAEFKALGLWCVIHGPEAWLALVVLCGVSVLIVAGMFLGALLAANGRDDDNGE